MYVIYCECGKITDCAAHARLLFEYFKLQKHYSPEKQFIQRTHYLYH